MKVSFLKHCFGESIDLVGENSYFMEATGEDWHKDFQAINNVTVALIKKVDRETLEENYRHEISHDYQNPINKKDEELRNELIEYFQNFDLSKGSGSSFHYFNILKDLLAYFTEDIEYDYCEQCGDQNCDFELEIEDICC